PPGPKSLPSIGNFHQWAGALPHQALTRLSKQHGPVMKLQLGELLALVISSPGATQEVLKTNEISFAQRHETFAGQHLVTSAKIKMILVPLVEEILPLAAGFVITDLYPSLKFLCSVSGMKSKV
ncbi:hypothetical protein CISIN_1g037456mg, partial [Citrus sinensis]